MSWGKRTMPVTRTRKVGPCGTTGLYEAPFVRAQSRNCCGRRRIQENVAPDVQVTPFRGQLVDRDVIRSLRVR